MEPFITIGIGLFLVAYMRLSSQIGLFRELGNMLAMVLGLWVALRYWYPVTAYLHGDLGRSAFHLPPANAALVAFWVLMLAVAVPLLVMFNRLDDRHVPDYPRPVEMIFGLVFGIGTSVAVACAVMISVSVFIPKVSPGFDRETLLVPWDRIPINVYQYAETEWLGVQGDDPGKTRFPTYAREQMNDFDAYWQ